MHATYCFLLNIDEDADADTARSEFRDSTFASDRLDENNW